MWGLDLAFADVVASSTDPNLGAIRLAWWRERLEELDAGKEPPAEPRLSAVAAELLPRGVTGKALSKLEDAWSALLQPLPWSEAQAEGLKLRGRILFGIGTELLGRDADEGAVAGALWSLVDGAHHCSDVRSRLFLLEHARETIALLPRHRPARELRAMTVLTALAAHDVLRNKPLDIGGDLGRVVVATAHRLRGTLPRS